MWFLFCFDIQIPEKVTEYLLLMTIMAEFLFTNDIYKCTGSCHLSSKMLYLLAHNIGKNLKYHVLFILF